MQDCCLQALRTGLSGAGNNKQPNPKPLMQMQRDFTCLQSDLVKDGLKSHANLVSPHKSEAPNNLYPQSYSFLLLPNIFVV